MNIQLSSFLARKILSSLALAVIAGCAPQIDVPTINTGDSGESAKVTQAPQLEGSWTTGCTVNSSSPNDGTRKQFTFHGEELVRETYHYTNSPKCESTPVVIPQEAVHVLPITQSKDGIYQLEYTYTSGPQTPAVYQYVKIADGKMYLSGEHYVRGIADKLTTILTRVADVPSTGPATKATSWSNAKYVLCSNQGIATLIDLSSSNLVSQSVRSPRFKQWRCYSTPPVAWQEMNGGSFTATTRTFTLSLQARDRIDIHESGFSGTYKQFPYAYSTVFGNSGECFFIQSQATQNLNFDFGCN